MLAETACARLGSVILRTLAFGEFEQQVGYLLFTPTNVSKLTSCHRIWIQMDSRCNDR